MILEPSVESSVGSSRVLTSLTGSQAFTSDDLSDKADKNQQIQILPTRITHDYIQQEPDMMQRFITVFAFECSCPQRSNRETLHPSFFIPPKPFWQKQDRQNQLGLDDLIK